MVHRITCCADVPDENLAVQVLKDLCQYVDVSTRVLQSISIYGLLMAGG